MANKHMPYDLKQMQSIPLEGKIIMTQERIRQWYEHWDGQVYVSFSGGKDSTVLKHIVDGMYDDVPALFVNTGLEYPEIQRFAMSQKNVVTVRPEMRFDEVIRKHGYPVISKHVSQVIEKARRSLERGGDGGIRLQMLEGIFIDPKTGKLSQYNVPQYKYLFESDIPISSECCTIMKKTPLLKYEYETGRKPFIGTLASESRNRMRIWTKYGCNAFSKENPSSQPLSFWTKQDVLHYINKFAVPYCPVYGDIVIDAPISANSINGQINAIDYLGDYDPEDKLKTTGCDRTGCIFCMFGCQLEKEPNRFQRLKQTHPRQYEYCIGGGEMVDGKWQPSKEGLGLGKVLDYINVKY